VKQTGQGTGSSPDASGAPHSSCSSAAAAAAASSAATTASYSASAAASGQTVRWMKASACVMQARQKRDGPRSSAVAQCCPAQSGGWGLPRAFVAQLVRQRRLEAGQQRVRLSSSQRRLLKMSAIASAALRLEPPRRCMPALHDAPGRRGRCLRLRLASPTPAGATREAQK
jgi:hypothetical protein